MSHRGERAGYPARNRSGDGSTSAGSRLAHLLHLAESGEGFRLVAVIAGFGPDGIRTHWLASDQGANRPERMCTFLARPGGRYLLREGVPCAGEGTTRSRKDRPIDASVLGVLVILTAIPLVLIGLAGISNSLAGPIPGPFPVSGNILSTLFVSGFVFLATGAVLVFAGGGFLAVRTWAWWLAAAAAVAALAYTAYVYLAFGTLGGRVVGITGLGGVLFLAMTASVLEVITLTYLVSVYRSFQRNSGAVA